MKRTFNLFFSRPDNYFGLEVEVPDWWEEVSYGEQCVWLDKYVKENDLRQVWLEDADEVI